MENFWQALWWRKAKGVKENHVSLCKNPHIESEIQSYLQALHCKRTSECFTIPNFLFLFLQRSFSVNTGLGKEFKSCWKLRCRILKWDTIVETARPPLHRDTQITFPLHNLVLKSPCSSIILYTYTKLWTPVFSVKRCYAYLYCMYVYPFFCSWTVLLYLPQSQMW